MLAIKQIGEVTVDLIRIPLDDARELATLLIDVAPFAGDTAFRRIFKALEAAGVGELEGVVYLNDGHPVTVKRT